MQVCLATPSDTYKRTQRRGINGLMVISIGWLLMVPSSSPPVGLEAQFRSLSTSLLHAGSEWRALVTILCTPRPAPLHPDP